MHLGVQDSCVVQGVISKDPVVSVDFLKGKIYDRDSSIWFWVSTECSDEWEIQFFPVLTNIAWSSYVANCDNQKDHKNILIADTVHHSDVSNQANWDEILIGYISSFSLYGSV